MKFVCSLAFVFFCGVVHAGTLYISTAGLATNSGSTDSPTATISLATVTISGTAIQWPTNTDLSGVVTSGYTQSSVFVKDATNSNQKIFWISAVNDGLDITSATIAITGTVASSATLGGQHLWTKASIESSVVAGTTVVFKNSPASDAATIFTQRVVGSTTLGPIKVMGAAGSRPKLTCTGTSVCLIMSFGNSWYENLEIEQQGASGNGVTMAASVTFRNMKVSDAGGNCIAGNPTGWVIENSEISGCSGDGLNMSAVAYGPQILGNYIHDNGGDGADDSTTDGGAPTTINFSNNIFDTNTAMGININGAISSPNTCMKALVNNVIYGHGADGLKTTDKDVVVFMKNNIFKDNGNVASEYNVNMFSSSSLTTSSYNILDISGAVGGGNVNNYAIDATDLASDPLFTNAAGGDFSVGSTSPAKAAGYPGIFLGSSTGYLDIGAVQRQEPSASGAKTTFIFD